MSIPHFKSQHDWEAFTQIFDSQWHCEHGSITYGNRLLLAILYLNDVKEGGETEFLYQSLRVSPKQGTLLFCPSGFTHTHRGNPPLSGEKYIMNTWIEFTE